MNDFTKEELKDIETVYRSFCGDGRVLTNLEQTIMKKLKSVVDNYCEHENSGQDYSCSRCWDCHVCW